MSAVRRLPRVRERESRRKRPDDLVPALAFLLPNLLGFVVFTAWPVVFSFAASFTNWSLQRSVPLEWVGLRNYADLLTDPASRQFFANTVYFLIGVPLSIAGSLVLAILLNQRMRGMAAYRILLYLPSFASGVAVMILWKQLFNPDFGPINALIRSVGDALGQRWDGPNWLGSTKNLAAMGAEGLSIDRANFGVGARDALILMGLVTGIGGGNMLLYLAALSGLPPDLVEAAQLDGAGRWAVFRNVVWPQLAPTTFFILVMSTIGGLQGGFETARVMTNGGPAGSTTTIGYLIYNKAFSEFQIGYASAVAWTLFAIVFAVTLVNWRFGSRAEADVL